MAVVRDGVTYPHKPGDYPKDCGLCQAQNQK